MSSVQLFLGSFERRVPQLRMKRHKNIIDITKLVRKKEIPENADLQPVILVDIVETDFRCSEATRFLRYVQAFRRGSYVFQPNHTIAMVSRNHKIVEFFVSESKINNTCVLDTRRWRLSEKGDEIWDDDNIVYYAAQCGFELIIPSRKTISEIMYIVEMEAA